MYRPLKGYDSATDRNSLWNQGDLGKNTSKNTKSNFVAPRMTLQQKLLASKRKKALINLVSLDRVENFETIREVLISNKNRKFDNFKKT